MDKVNLFDTNSGGVGGRSDVDLIWTSYLNKEKRAESYDYNLLRKN